MALASFLQLSMWGMKGSSELEKGSVLEFLAVGANELSAELRQAWKEPFPYSRVNSTFAALVEYSWPFCFEALQDKRVQNGGRRDKMRISIPKC